MAYLRAAAVACAAVLLSVAGAAGKDEWKTVTLGGNPEFTVSVPSVVKDHNFGSKDKDDLLFFSVKARDSDLTCIAYRSDYPKDGGQAAFAAALATERREILCNHDGPKVSGLSIGGSRSLAQNGLQAAVCKASYTDRSQKPPGTVRSVMVVAAPDKAHFLICTVQDEDQELAEYEWGMVWGEKVRHIQESFRVPK